MECEWREHNGLSLRQLCQGVARHPQTGEMSFFNQVQLHHTYCLDKGTRESIQSIFTERDLPRHVYFGDGSVIEESVMDHVGETLEKTAVRFQWQQGDLIMLDNMLTAHARDPYVGARKIVVAMGNMVNAREIQLAASAVQV
jgi:alpha-ketoglutarate-dependent taurine dioxygenase